MRKNPYSQAQWEEAKTLYESPGSVPIRKIAEKVGIPHPTIDRFAKKEGWLKQGLIQLIQDTVKVRETFDSLSVSQKNVVQKAVDDELATKRFYDDAQNKLAKIGLNLIDDKIESNELTAQDLRGVSSVVKDSREGVIGKPSAVTVNNQINNNVGLTLEDIRRELDILSGRIIN